MDIDNEDIVTKRRGRPKMAAAPLMAGIKHFAHPSGDVCRDMNAAIDEFWRKRARAGVEIPQHELARINGQYRGLGNGGRWKDIVINEARAGERSKRK